MITTVASDQHQILRAIMELYCPDGFDLDPTYSTGKFYQHGVPEPRLKFDIAPHPRAEDVMLADVRSLPLPSESIRSAIFDPPFLHAHGKQSKIGNRFGSYPSQRSLHAMYREALAELHRVLALGGVLVMKCQDVIESSKQVMSHCLVWEAATALGFETLDLFVLTSSRVMVGWNHHQQQHGRKTHCYFWVFRKPHAKRGTKQ